MFDCKAKKGRHYLCFNVLFPNVFGSESLDIKTRFKKSNNLLSLAITILTNTFSVPKILYSTSIIHLHVSCYAQIKANHFPAGVTDLPFLRRRSVFVRGTNSNFKYNSG